MDPPELPSPVSRVPPGLSEMELQAGEKVLDAGPLKSGWFHQWAGPNEAPTRIKLTGWAGTTEALHVMNARSTLRMAWPELLVTIAGEKRTLVGKGVTFEVASRASQTRPVIGFWLTESAAANLTVMAGFYGALAPPTGT